MRQEPEVIAEVIGNVDLDGLIPEHCELLLQIVPQETEVCIPLASYIQCHL